MRRWPRPLERSSRSGRRKENQSGIPAARTFERRSEGRASAVHGNFVCRGVFAGAAVAHFADAQLQEHDFRAQRRVDKQTLEAQLEETQKKLDEETALNDQLLQASQEEESADQQVLRDKEQELDHTRQAYDALLTALSCDTHEGNVTFSRAMETVERYKECLSEDALAAYETLQEQ